MQGASPFTQCVEPPWNTVPVPPPSLIVTVAQRPDSPVSAKFGFEKLPGEFQPSSRAEARISVFIGVPSVPVG